MGGLASDCNNDGMPSNPILGRGIAEDTQSIYVSKCGSNRCKACMHIVEDNSFTNNITNRTVCACVDSRAVAIY